MNARLALVNTIIQAALIVAAFAALWLAKKKLLKRHCLVMRSAVAVQIVLIGAIMAPSLAGYLGNWNGWSWFTAELIIHHILGAVVILLFIFFNLVLTGVIKLRRRLLPYMRTAFVLWVVVLGVGAHLYWYIWI